MNIRPGRTADVQAVAELHMSQIAEGFLPTLGRPFMTALYRRIVIGPGSFLVVADDGGCVAGMAAVTTDTQRLYRTFVLHDGLRVVARSVHRLIRAVPRVLETLRYGSSVRDLPAAEVLSVAVRADKRGRGIGGELLAAAKAELVARGITAVRVVTSSDNTAALSMYQRAGFHPVATIEVHRGTSSRVLTWP